DDRGERGVRDQGVARRRRARAVRLRYRRPALTLDELDGDLGPVARKKRPRRRLVIEDRRGIAARAEERQRELRLRGAALEDRRVGQPREFRNPAPHVASRRAVT